MDRAPPAWHSNGPASMVGRKGRAINAIVLIEVELLVAEICGLATTHLDSLAPSIEDSGMSPAVFSCFALIYNDLCQPVPAPGIAATGTAVANNSGCAVPQRSPCPAGAFSCDCMFWGESGGGLTRQPVGPSWIQQS